MRRGAFARGIATCGVLLAAAAALADNETTPAADNATAAAEPCQSCETTLTKHLFGAGHFLSEQGLDVALTFVGAYQANVRGGLSTHRRTGRFSGGYDLELTLDFEKAHAWKGGTLYALIEGDSSEGIDAPAVGSLFGVNYNDANVNRPIDVTQLWYEQSFADGLARVRFGKIFLPGGFECRGCPASFDGNSFAGDATTQFLNAAFVNNPTIPFPDEGLGVVGHFQPTDWLYVSAGMADAEANRGTTGFRTTFDGGDEFFYIAETGVLPQIPSTRGPLQGAYRFGVWCDHQDATGFDGRTRGRRTGFYASVDQQLWRESEADDGQGLGVFFRYGRGDGDADAIRNFYSIGAQYQGLLPGRDQDVLGVGYAKGRLHPDADFTAGLESVVEIYYNARVTPWLEISPSVQFITHPGGDDSVRNATVVGLRALLRF